MSYKLKLVLVITILLTITFSLGASIIIYRTYQQSFEREEKEAVESLQRVRGIIGIVADGNEEFDDESIIEMMKKLESEGESSDIYMLYKDEAVLYSSGQASKDVDIKKIKNGIKGDDDIYVYYKKEKKSIRYIVCSSCLTVENNKYYLCFIKDAEHINEMRRSMLRIYRNSFLVIVFVTIITTWIVSSIMVRPLSKLAKATNAIADGNYSYRSNIKRLDEIGSLSQDFDRMAESMEENVELLEESAREKDRFMGAFTHELKTPMTSIIGYSELLMTQELSDEDKEDALDYIHSEAKRLENLSLKLLQLFVMDKDKVEFAKCSPMEITKDIVEHLKPELKEAGIDISLKTEKGYALLEQDLVRTLIINLIDNSRKAIEGNGHIEVEQSMTEDGTIIAISDDGKGMPEEAIKKVTEAFYRVDKARSRAQGGAGLGLSIVAKIIELHNGSLDIQSELGKGTRIEVTLRGGRINE